MNDQQNNKLINSISSLETSICAIAFITIILGSCGAWLATDKIATEIRNAGREISYEIKHKDCR